MADILATTEQASCRGSATHTKDRYLLVSLLLVFLLALAVYCNTLYNGFVYDDLHLIIDNPWIRHIRHLRDIFSKDMWAFNGGASGYYRPIMHVTYMFSYYISGLHPLTFHLVNILLNAMVCMLFFLVLLALLKKSDLSSSASLPLSALIGAILFIVHPIHAEVVAWVAGIPELTFVTFFLLSLLLYIYSATGQSVYYWLSVLAFFLATLCKETALTLPIVLLAYDYAFRPGSCRFTQLRRYAPYLLAAGCYFLLRFSALHGLAGLPSYKELTLYQCAINALPLFMQYIWKLFVPIDLSAFYQFHPILSIFTLQGMVALSITVAFVTLFWMTATKDRVIFFGLVLFVLPLLPALYIPGLGESIFAERYLYLPSVGFVFIITILIARLKERNAINAYALSIIIAVVVLVFAVGTITRNLVWKDAVSLWSDTVRKAPDSAFVHDELGLAYANKGRIDEAVNEYQYALRLKPSLVKARNHLGMAYAAKGLFPEAIAEYQQALAVELASLKAENQTSQYYEKIISNLGMAYLKMGQPDKALAHFKNALQTKPEWAEIYVNIGSAYDDKGLLDEAIKAYEKALQLQPDIVGAQTNLGIAYAKLGMIDKAIAYFQQALQLSPQDASIHFNLAHAYRIKGWPAKAQEQEREARTLQEHGMAGQAVAH